MAIGVPLRRIKMSAGIVGGLVGCTLGVLVGILGTFFCIRNANGAEARVTMIKWALIIWGGLSAFAGLLIVTPKEHCWSIWLLYAAFTYWAVHAMNREQASATRAEASEVVNSLSEQAYGRDCPPVPR
jgi:hypothetical protein